LDPERMIAFGAFVMVATANDAGRTAVTRGWALSVMAGGRVELCIIAADDSEVRSNVDSTGQVAVVVMQPQDYTSVQLKGVASVVRPLGSDDKARVDAHLAKAVDATKFVGLEAAEAFMLGELNGSQARRSAAWQPILARWLTSVRHSKSDHDLGAGGREFNLPIPTV